MSFEPVGTGLNVYESPEIVEGVVKWLETPEDVISFVQGGADVSDVVVMARGGTTTFLTMALNAGVRGVVTLQGAPESHLGIVCREFGIPCIMSVAFAKGVRTGRGETIPADGARVRLDVSSRPQGTVSVAAGAPVDDSPPPADATPAMSEEQMAQIMLLLEKFGGVVPHGAEGDQVMRAEMTTRVLYADDDSMHRDLTVAEVNEAVRYYTWNEWDALAARATEGESGLIPRQEYEAMGIMNCWFCHPGWLRTIEDRVGVDGIIDIGATGRREIGTKVNMLHLWALATATSFGRGIALELNLHDLDYKADRVRDCFGVVRRLYKGLWGDGPVLSSMRGFQAPILDPSWIERFSADRISLDDPGARSAFTRFNGAAELMGFLLHFDNRLGLGDTGPYPLPDGGFVLVRDLFVNEPAFPWSADTEGLPYAFTIAMFFGADSGLQTQMTDLSTVFTTPANYLPYVQDVAVYARETWDTPMADIRRLTVDDMTAMRERCEQQSAALYGRIAAMSKREKIEAGAMVYTAGFALPIARAAGMYDELVSDHRFLQIHPAVQACYDTIISGVATEMIPRLFLTGSWGKPVPEHGSDSLTDDGSEFAVLHALRVRGFASAAQVAQSSGLPGFGLPGSGLPGSGLPAEQVSAVLAGTTERGHTKERTGRVSGFTLTPAGRARHVLLREDATSPAAQRVVAEAYASFLEPNKAFKQLTTQWQLERDGDRGQFAGRLEQINDAVLAVVDQAAQAQPRFAGYRPRFEAALDRFRAGDDDALAKPMTGSYHDVWMEFHEDLLATLGRPRGDDDE
jgi:PEP-utilising enzyme, mobile domain